MALSKRVGAPACVLGSNARLAKQGRKRRIAFELNPRFPQVNGLLHARVVVEAWRKEYNQEDRRDHWVA